MSLITTIVEASTVLSSSLPRAETRDLLHYRKELESALIKLEQVLNTRAPKNAPESKRSCQTCRENASQIRVLEQNDTSQSPDISPPAQPQPLLQSRSAHREASIQHSILPRQTDISRISDAPPAVPRHDTLAKQPKEPQDKVSSLMKKLEEKSEDIHTFTNVTATKVVANGDWKEQDPRIVDANLPYRDSSLSTRLRIWLARCALADEYLAWEKDKHKSSRVENLAKNLEKANTGKGHIGEFLKTHYGDPARKGIEQGIRCRVFEHVYGTLGVSAFLFCISSAFRAVNYMEFPRLAESIRNSPDWSTFANRKTSWLADSQKIYNSSCRQYIHGQTQTRKHSIETETLSEQDQSKRAKRTSARTTLAPNDGSSSQLPDQNEANDAPKTLSTQTEVCASRSSDLSNAQLLEIHFTPSDNQIPITSQDSAPFSSRTPSSNAAPIVWSDHCSGMSNFVGRIHSADEATPSVNQNTPNSKERNPSDHLCSTGPETGGTDLLNWDMDFDSLGWDMDFMPGLDWDRALDLQWAQLGGNCSSF